MTSAGNEWELLGQSPPEAAAAAGEREDDGDAFPGGCETILVVEDDETVRDVAVQILQMHGYEVISAADGAGALGLCGSGRDGIHLIVVDIVLPDMSGRSLAGLLKSSCGSPAVLYMSGYTGDVVMQQGMLEQGASFIGKPFVMASFLRKVREVLDSGTQEMMHQGSGQARTGRVKGMDASA